MLFATSVAAQDLNYEARKAWPNEFLTVGEVVQYYIEPTHYKLFLDEKSNRIAKLRIATLPSGEIKPVAHILLEVIPDGYVLVVDEKRRLVTFDYE